MTTSTTPLAARPSFVSSARALWRLSWARTMTPLLLLGVALLVLLPMLFAAVFQARATPESDVVEFLVVRYDRLIITLSTPLIALLLGTSAFSAEAEDGTLLYLVTTTTPRWWIAATRVLFAAVLTALLSVVSVVGTGIIATGGSDPERVIRAFAAAAAIGGAAYASLFTALAVLTRRALVTGLGYVLFWEGILSETFQGIKYLSVHQWMLSITNAITTADADLLSKGPSVAASVIGAAVVFVLAIVLSGRRLHTPRISRIGT